MMENEGNRKDYLLRTLNLEAMRDEEKKCMEKRRQPSNFKNIF